MIVRDTPTVKGDPKNYEEALRNIAEQILDAEERVHELKRLEKHLARQKKNDEPFNV